MDLSQREHVRVHLDPSLTRKLPPIVDGLFIGKPVLGKVPGRWTVQLSRTEHVAVNADLLSGELQFPVPDTGPGVPADMHEAILERFRQGDSKVSYEHGGTGMGLVLSRGLAELMGGKLFADTHITSGARFVLTIPLPAHS